MSRTFAVALVLLSAIAVVASATASRPRLAVRPSTVAPGGIVLLTGSAGTCSVGSTVIAISAAFPGHAYGQGELTGRVRSGHGFSIVGHVRRGLRPGSHRVTARCGGGNLGVAATVRVG
jgi:hypothetical protein